MVLVLMHNALGPVFYLHESVPIGYNALKMLRVPKYVFSPNLTLLQDPAVRLRLMARL